jgi:hypothetical protein
VLTAP